MRGRRSTATSSTGSAASARARRAREAPARVELEPVLRGQARQVQVGQDAQRRHARARLEHGEAGREQRRVAAELVDHEPAHVRALLGREQRDGAVERREHAAAIDVADQQHRRAAVARHAHVHDVVLREVDLGRASRALGDDEVVRGAQPVERAGHHRPQLGLARVVGARVGDAQRAAEHHDLRRPVALRLEQHRVHVDRGRDARGERLRGLRAADLAAVVGDGGVVRHVLRLERRHAQPRAREDAAERGDEGRLAGVRRGALHHEHAAERRAVDRHAALTLRAGRGWGGCASRRIAGGRARDKRRAAPARERASGLRPSARRNSLHATTEGANGATFGSRCDAGAAPPL
jgi:hypothetical protein